MPRHTRLAVPWMQRVLLWNAELDGVQLFVEQQLAYNFGLMSLIALWIGVLIFGLGAIFSLLSAVRSLQISRRWSDYRLRRRYIVQARGSVLLSVLSGALAAGLLIFGRLAQPTGRAAALHPH